MLSGILPDVLSKDIDPNLSGPVVSFTSVKSCLLPQTHSRLGVKEHQAQWRHLEGSGENLLIQVANGSNRGNAQLGLLFTGKGKPGWTGQSIIAFSVVTMK